MRPTLRALGWGLLAIGILRAQPETSPFGPRPGPPPSRQKMEALMVWQLTDELNLTEDQSTEFFPKWKKLRRIRGQHHADRIAVLSDLTEVLKDESDRTTELKGLVDSLETLDENFRSAERKVRHELAGILTIEQQARLIVFQAGFERQTRRLIEQIRKERGRRDRKQD